VKKLSFLLAGLFALALVAQGCGAAAANAATVNGHTISQKDLNDELEAIKGNKTYAQAVEQQLAQGGEKLSGSGNGTFDSTFVARVLTRQVFLAIVHEALLKRHIEVKPSDITAAEKSQQDQFQSQFGNGKVWLAFPKTYRDTLARRAAEVQALQNGLSTTKVDDKAVAAYYNSHKAEFEQTCVSHILAAFPGLGSGSAPPQPSPADDAAAKAKAQGWKDKLNAGADFAALAKAESQDPGSAPNGGDLGCQGGFVKEFTDAMNALQPGQISDPVRSQFGWHIIKVTSRKQQTLAEATPQIQQTLQGQQQNVIQDFLTKALKTAKITVNPKYGHFEKGDPNTGQQPEIVPPKGPTTTSTTAPLQVPGGLGGAGAGGSGGSGTPSGGGSQNP
jgi:PPIC-type PPIASE domain